MLQRKALTKSILSMRRDDLRFIIIILLYCITYATTRLLVSSTMELDEAEQFLNSSVFHLGYSNQPPLYNWLVKIASSLFGLNLVTLIIIKYSLIFLFYFVFYILTRTFWEPKVALLITGSLVLFPLYSYEFNRDLSHTILLSTMVLLTCFFYSRILMRGKTIYYVLTGLSIGMGILSKYNYAFFLLALTLASISCREGRRVIFDKRLFLTVLSAVLVLLPHFLWLIKEGFPSVYFAINKAKIGVSQSPSIVKIFSIAGTAYLDVLGFTLIFLLLFYQHNMMNTKNKNLGMSLFRWLCFYGLLIPLLAIFILQIGIFRGRWLAPVLFTLPFAMFSMIDLHIVGGLRSKIFGSLCVFIVVALLIMRMCIGFMPDLVNKVERIHIPFKEISLSLSSLLKDKENFGVRDIFVITDDVYIAANIMAWLPGIKFISLESLAGDISVQNEVYKNGGILVRDAKKLGENVPKSFLKICPSAVPLKLLKSPYSRSKKFGLYVLGVATVPKMNDK